MLIPTSPEHVLRQFSIPFVTSGPNVQQGNINIKCPFCGAADPAFHMGINLKTGQWGCWRNTEHRGQNFRHLLSRLVGPLVAEAVDLDNGPMPQSTERNLQPPLSNSLPTLPLPREFHLVDSHGLGERFYKYLVTRGFSRMEARQAFNTYGLRCALVGDYAHRIIFPVFERGRLVAWTGRAITQNAQIRYKSNGSSIKKTLLFFDSLRAQPNPTLCLTEGPLDALKLDFYGRDFGIRATCLFGSSISSEQITLLMDLKQVYKQIKIIPDRGAFTTAAAVSSKCSFLGVTVNYLPLAQSDPGALNRKEVIELCQRIH